MINNQLPPTIYFDSINHRYFDTQQRTFISVTQLLDKYKKPFDKIYWAKYKAKERGVSVDTILNEWQTINRDACHKGNMTHDRLDSGISGEQYRTSEKDFRKVILNNEVGSTSLADSLYNEFPVVANMLSTYITKGWKIFSEKRVFLYDEFIAGTIDCPIIKDDEFEIFDWKTNKDELKFKSGYYKKINGIKTNVWINTDDKLLYPVNDLPDCKGSLYTLQLSFYAYMLERLGYKCVGLKLFHFINGQTVMCPIPYLRSHIEKIILHHSSGVGQKLGFGF